MSRQTGGIMVEVDGAASAVATMNVISSAINNGRNYIVIQNTHPTQTLGWTCTVGLTPVLGSVGFTLLPGGSYTADTGVFQGPVNVIGSGAGTTYHIGTF